MQRRRRVRKTGPVPRPRYDFFLNFTERQFQARFRLSKYDTLLLLDAMRASSGYFDHR